MTNDKNYIVADIWMMLTPNRYRAFKEKCLSFFVNHLIDDIENSCSNVKRFATLPEALEAYEKTLSLRDEYDFYSVMHDDYVVYGIFLFHYDDETSEYELVDHLITKTYRTYKGKVIYGYDE